MSGTIYVVPSAGSYLASIAEVPGCVARGATKDEAVANARRSFRDYLEMLGARGVSTEHWNGLDPDGFAVKDAPDDRLLPEDARPLEEHEIRDFLHQLDGSRSALLALVRGLSADDTSEAAAANRSSDRIVLAWPGRGRVRSRPAIRSESDDGEKAAAERAGAGTATGGPPASPCSYAGR